MKDSKHLPFAMKRIIVGDANMAYIDEGSGPVILFLHGNPTSSYLWRNIIPYMLSGFRCIAPDLIGFGQSDKPEIGYFFDDHAQYLQHFTDKLGLQDIILVLHDWGSALGLDWARRNEHRVKGLVLMEFMHPFPTWRDLDEQGAAIFKQFRDPEKGRALLIDQNVFIEQLLPAGILKKLSEEDLDVYREPFLSTADREPIYRFPNELPIAGHPVNVYTMAVAYHEWLLQCEQPKLFFWVSPGALVSVRQAQYYQTFLKKCKTVNLGPGAHYLQEDYPDEIGSAIRSWLEELN
jgi:haloalkane dehalogenase